MEQIRLRLEAFAKGAKITTYRDYSDKVHVAYKNDSHLFTFAVIFTTLLSDIEALDFATTAQIADSEIIY